MPGSYFQLMLRHCGTTLDLRDAILADTGVSLDALEQPGSEVTLGQQLQLLRNVNRTFPPGVALAIGARYEPITHGALGFGAVSAPTLGAALDVIARFVQVRSLTHSGRTVQTRDELRLVFEERCALEDDERRPLIEIILLSVQGMIEAVLAGPMTAGRFEIAAPKPSYAARYADYFHAEVRFGSAHTGVVIPVAWCTLACPHADPVMHEASLRELEMLARRLDGAGFTAARVEQWMSAAGDAGVAIDDVAHRLGLSRRTLARRLREEGTTYHEIRDAHLQRRAKSLLAEGTLTKAEIAYRLGYQDPANFGRAFRRWFGSVTRDR